MARTRNHPSDTPEAARERMRAYRATPRGRREVQAHNAAYTELIKRHRREYDRLRETYRREHPLEGEQP